MIYKNIARNLPFLRNRAIIMNGSKPPACCRGRGSPLAAQKLSLRRFLAVCLGSLTRRLPKAGTREAGLGFLQKPDGVLVPPDAFAANIRVDIR
jgi:hypothetical protein